MKTKRIAKSEVSRFANRIMIFFCFCCWDRFRCGPFLIAAYCKKCKSIKLGNPVYYDGTQFQKNKRGVEAKNFIKELLVSVNNLEEAILNPALSDSYETLLDRLKAYESSEFYNNILSDLDADKHFG